jgi:Ca2+-binding EF-hand superfamily protein
MLDKKEFANIEKELQSSSTPAVQKNSSASKATNPKVIKAAFDMLKDSDEEISDRAFMKFLAEQNGMPSQDAMKIFVSLDKSKNGRLDFKEFSKLFDKTNSFMDSVKSIASIIPLLLVAPILWVMDKVGLFNNIK